jgi:hypothetical protein
MTVRLLDARGKPYDLTGDKEPSERPKGIDLYLQAPSVETMGDWTTQKAKALSYAHQLGQFNLSARMYYAMLCDPRVIDGLEKRALALRQMPFDVIPGKGRGAKQLAKKVADHLDLILPPAVVTEAFYLALMLGPGVCQPDWAYHVENDETFYPRLTPWHPQLLYFLNAALMGERRGSAPGMLYTYCQGVESGQFSTVSVPIVTGTGQWFCFTLYGVDKPHLYGKLLAIWRPWIGRLQAESGLVRYNDVHGMPMRGVQVPVRMRKTREGRRFFRTVSQIGQDATLYMPQSRDGKSAFDVKLIEAKSRNFETFIKSRDEWAKEIALALSGNLDSFDMKGDNYKRSQVRQEVRYEVKIADALAFQLAVNAQLMVPFAVLNGYDEEAAPQILYDVRPERSQLEENKINLAEAEGALKALELFDKLEQKGVKMDLMEFLEQRGIRMPLGSVWQPTSAREDEEPESQADEQETSAAIRAWQQHRARLQTPVPVWRFADGLGTRGESLFLSRAELLRQRQGAPSGLPQPFSLRRVA